ncbi:MAG: DUF3198 domain-containing protein [Thermoplasmata archaeon]|nr:DUF3198 domain-containing protein [Thermoplasmata archaeon]
MADEPERPPFERLARRLRIFLRTQRFIISIFVLAIGVLFDVLAFGAFTPLQSTPPFPTLNSAAGGPGATSGGWNYTLTYPLLGVILTIVGAYLVGAYYVARKRFEHLMLTKSKAEFLRNIPELEDLLWDLTPNDEVRYADKRAELRVRR